MMSFRCPRQPKPYFCTNLSLSDFEVGEELGVGAFGRVNLCRNKQTKTYFAIKFIDLTEKRKSQLSIGEIVKMTKKELEVLYQLNHENILRLKDHFEDRNGIYLITEFVRGVLADTRRKTSLS